MKNVAVEQILILKKQQKQITLTEGKINKGTRQDRPQGQPVVEGRNISWDRLTKKAQIARVSKMRKNGLKNNFCFRTIFAPEWAKGLISFMKSSIKSTKISTSHKISVE